MTFDELYDKIKEGQVTRGEAMRHFSLEWMDTAQKSIFDVNRGMRTNIPEIVYGEFKTLEQTLDICSKALSGSSRVVVSRSPFNEQIGEHFSGSHPVFLSPLAIVVGELPQPRETVLVVSAGSADRPVAQECELVLKALGVTPLLFEDRGIAHPTRVLDAVKQGMDSDVSAVIVVAGMEGALAPFVASLVPLPVIGVPTSVGYGFRASEAALTSMLASCAPNLTVVNVDGGVRAAVSAALIAKNRR